jgi:hypothetical protein
LRLNKELIFPIAIIQVYLDVAIREVSDAAFVFIVAELVVEDTQCFKVVHYTDVEIR